MELIGVIHTLGEEQKFSETFEMQLVYLDCSTYEQGTGRKFENILKIQFVNAKIDLLKGFQVGERVKVSFNIQGRFREVDGKTYHNQNLNAWKIEKLN